VRPHNRAPHTGSGRGRPAADGGVLDITAAVWTAGFHGWRSGNKKRTQNVSEYMLVLALCLVVSVVHSLLVFLLMMLNFILWLNVDIILLICRVVWTEYLSGPTSASYPYL